VPTIAPTMPYYIFDRIIFKGYLTSMFPDGAFGRYLSKRGVLLKDAGKFFESETGTLIQHAKTTAEEAGRPYHFLASAHTHASGRSKEAMARAIAEQDGISEGLVCIFSPSPAIVRHNVWKSSGVIAAACICTGI
jgi:hypothetical protein